MHLERQMGHKQMSSDKKVNCHFTALMHGFLHYENIDPDPYFLKKTHPEARIPSRIF